MKDLGMSRKRQFEPIWRCNTGIVWGSFVSGPDQNAVELGSPLAWSG